MNKQARHVLEAIAFGEDPQITPSDRLRACEQLARHDEVAAPSESFWGELSGLDGDELNSQLDAVLAEAIVEDVFGARTSWPHLAELVDLEVERRARTLAEELHLDHVEAEVERRVSEELARREGEAKPEPVPTSSEQLMPSADPSNGARHEPRYQPQSALRRRYRSRLLTG